MSGARTDVERLAVAEQQVADYHPTALLKATDRRSFVGTSTTQAEALSPDVLADVLCTAIEAHRDMEGLAALLECEEEQRGAISERLQR